MRIWGRTTLGESNVSHWQIGPLGIWVRHRGDEWQVAADRGLSGITACAFNEDGDVPADLEWRRWVVDSHLNTVQLSPAMPDRPVVVRPEYPIRLPPKQQALFYLSIPVWVQVVVDEEKLVLCEEPSTVLSNIWFGDYASGELCYSLKTRARREVNGGGEGPHRAICPVSITNGARDELDFQRLCIRVDQLKIVERGDQLWTNQVNVLFRGEDQASRIDYEQRAEVEGTVLAEPRNPQQSSVIRRSFRNLGLLNLTQ